LIHLQRSAAEAHRIDCSQSKIVEDESIKPIERVPVHACSFRQLMALPEKDRRAVLRMLDSLSKTHHAAKGSNTKTG